MQIFLDTANIQEIKQWNKLGIIDGITTNPSHLSKEGGSPLDLITEICSTMQGKDVSVEITETTPDAVYKQAQTIAGLADNVVVKIPCHTDYYELIARLAKEGIKLNITLVFTLIQSLMMAKMGVRYISPFIGRWDDIDVEGSELLDELRAMIDQYHFDTKILAASLRGVRHLHQAIMSGADVATLPATVLKKALTHPLTDRGIAQFNADWQKLGIKTFP